MHDGPSQVGTFDHNLSTRLLPPCCSKAMGARISGLQIGISNR